MYYRGLANVTGTSNRAIQINPLIFEVSFRIHPWQECERKVNVIILDEKCCCVSIVSCKVAQFSAQQL